MKLTTCMVLLLWAGLAGCATAPRPAPLPVVREAEPACDRAGGHRQAGGLGYWCVAHCSHVLEVRESRPVRGRDTAFRPDCEAQRMGCRVGCVGHAQRCEPRCEQLYETCLELAAWAGD